jgi:hypothetical protein
MKSRSEFVNQDSAFGTVFSSPSKTDDSGKHQHIAAARRAAARPAKSWPAKYRVTATKSKTPSILY